MTAPTPWVQRRWAELCDAVRAAPLDWAAWAREQLTSDGVGHALAEAYGWEFSCGVHAGEYDAQRAPEARTAAGQFFTPGAVADALARLVPRAAQPGIVLDPACGAGELLCAVFRARLALGASTRDALLGLTGWDLDPTAAWGARASLVLCALNAATGPVPQELTITGGVDALEQRAEASVVVMNPPYLEAKRMRGAQPGLRERLKRLFPELRGAFDLYMAFLLKADDWLVTGGVAAAILPNKVCQSRYGAAFREQPTVHLLALDDLSRLSPRPFPGTSVYPVLIAFSSTPEPLVRVRHVLTPDQLATAPHRTVAASTFTAFEESPWFVPWQTWSILSPLLDGATRLAEMATVRSTCSFHKRGLRERYVVPERPIGDALPYVGGPSFTRTTEVRAYELNWAGWWIRDAWEELGARGNRLPPRSRFLRPKVILRQHARRLDAVVDDRGLFITKDVYPIAWPNDPALLHALVAVLNSTVFTALYNTVFQGIVVGGETYHYLPVFLRQVPVPSPDRWAELAEHGAQGRDGWLECDSAVASAYGISETQRAELVRVHLERVGADAP